jgi:hypothetical protein
MNMPFDKETGRREGEDDGITLADKLNEVMWGSIEYDHWWLSLSLVFWGLTEILIGVAFIYVMRENGIPGKSVWFVVIGILHFGAAVVSAVLWWALHPLSIGDCRGGKLVAILYFLIGLASTIMSVMVMGNALFIFCLVVPAIIAQVAYSFFTIVAQPVCESVEQFEKVSRLIISPDETERLKAFDDLYALLSPDKEVELMFFREIKKSGDEVLIKRVKEKRSESGGASLKEDDEKVVEIKANSSESDG